ncbi:TatD family hydrolase [Flavihumibacter petaseus]|uniref:Putative deoxyribonuclease n=1 Tax=Flavihumibacter petaseus NBRC 106054 TaxID=1220578 RepID=A0A0E9MVX6_9BACT|nr:TatD family hydrolase [Flavihumibacter petaseus]GAO41653.1 putative deoxyribonuclease [Flavihumibacter petaseus NBRC 106054]
MTLIDTHSHLYVNAFSKDVEQVLERAEAAGVTEILLPAIDSEEHDAMLRLEQQYPDKCLAMMGLHPCSVKEDYQAELQLVEEWLSRRPFAGVGEIGLDFYWDRTFEKQQFEAFRRQLELAKHHGIPVSIHSRNANREALDTVVSLQDGNLSGVFHCFSGDADFARQVTDAGFYLGIGGVVTYKNGGLAEILSQAGPERLVLETDAPYLSPVPFRGKRNESSYLTHIVAKLAEVFAMETKAIADLTSLNARTVFKLQQHDREQ